MIELRINAGTKPRTTPGFHHPWRRVYTRHKDRFRWAKNSGAAGAKWFFWSEVDD